MARLRAMRGEIWLVDMGMAQKVRPALVLSSQYSGQERALITFVGRTTSMRGTQYEVAHSAPHFSPGVFDVQSITTLPDVQLIKRLTVCDPATLLLVETALKKWLGFPP